MSKKCVIFSSQLNRDVVVEWIPSELYGMPPNALVAFMPNGIEFYSIYKLSDSPKWRLALINKLDKCILNRTDFSEFDNAINAGSELIAFSTVRRETVLNN